MVFFQEARPAREPFLRVPASVVVLIGLLAAAHLARVLAPAALSDRILNDYALDPIVYSAQALKALGAGTPTLLQRLAPPVSHIFLHGSLTHLAVNCLWLLAFGPVVARRFGAAAFFLFFLLCGLAGAASFVALDWGQNVGAIGASGAISGLMGAAIRMMRIREPYLNVATLPLEPLFSRQVLLFSAVWMAVNLLTGLFGSLMTGSGVAWQDHLGGYIAGLLLAGPFEHFVGYAANLRRRGA
ncbi:MAG TPA: rhomboid family intramembrane serine protease [Rhizomicrobium sp.]|jgi:membrane associated rhomboid family serine protease|nr:rhomboid family intramembrane serine protease [Rhizomicrobium sp.]